MKYLQQIQDAQCSHLSTFNDLNTKYAQMMHTICAEKPFPFHINNCETEENEKGRCMAYLAFSRSDGITNIIHLTNRLKY